MRNLINFKALFITLALFTITACGGSDSSSSDDISLSDIHGLWESTNANDYDYTFVDKDDMEIYFGYYNGSCYVEDDFDTFTLDGNKLVTDSISYSLDFDADSDPVSLTVKGDGETFTYDFVSSNIADEDICL